MKILKKISVVHLLLVLLVLCTYSQARAGSIAYIHGATNGQDSVYDYLSGHFTSMTLINANAPLPTLSQLLSYNAILVSTNRYWDGGVVRSSELGNLLADYVDAGGSLVVAAFSWQGEANGITGRFISGNYSPFTSGNGSKNADVHISHVFDRTNAIFTGVNDILGYYRDNVSPTGGSNVLAYWEDGVPLIAISSKNVIGINLFPETYYGFIGGDYEQLFVNLLKYAGVGSTSDIIPPEIVTNLNVTPYEERLVFTWNSSLNKGRDLAGYRVYFNNERGITLLPSENTFEKTGLDPATIYHFRVTAFDAANNESGNSYIKAATLADNPENIVATPHTGYVDLSWDASTPVNIIKNYKIYYKESNFDTVKFLDSKMTVNGTSCRVNGLINNVTYYFAVTAVNISNGENTTVIPVTAKPMPDTTGPTIGDVTLDGQVVSGSATINSYGLFSLSPLDELGVSRVEFYINDELKGKVYSTSGGKFVFGISAYDVEDGDYQISIKAYDSVGNVSIAGPFQLSVDLSKPVAPVIKSPATGFITNRNNVSIKGQAAKNTLVSLFNDDNEILNSIQVSDAGEFSADMPIHEGENTIHAIASNRAGSSPASQDVVVVLDNSLPTLPYGLSAKPNLNGEIYLTWQMADESNVAGYNVYRSDESFEDLDDAEKVNSRLITKKNYTDLPFDDGKWFYRITSVNKAGSESDMSPIVSATSDSIRPTAVSVTYDPKGNFDPQSGVMAPGLVNITVKTSEVLAATPFFSITPSGGKPCSITLEKVSELEYKGVYEITETTPSGTAYAVFSGRDLTGNRGTDILAGSTISIDTDGPAVRKITLTPQSPVKNDSQNPVEITAVFGLNEKIKNDTPIVFSYIIAGDTENSHTIDNVTEITTEEGDAQTFRAVFTLPGTAGEAAAESLTFAFSCLDKLGNAGNTFQSENNFQVYQGELPPLGIPLNFKGQSIPGGDIKLTWNAVASASGYQLYRKTPVEDTLTPFGTPLTASSLTFMDTPEVEGDYVYTIATIRSWNGQQSLSGQSAPVVVSSDATAPSPPTGLVLDLIPKGIRAVWTAPAYQEELTYAFYRARSEADISAGNMTLIQKGFKQTSWIDFNPSVTDHFYVVTTIDRTGNESAPSATGYFNAKLLPVSTVTVNINENSPPRLAWAHPGGDIAGFDLYTGNGESREKVGEGLITGHEYTDSGYTGTDLRVYTLQAVDAQGAKSLEREISVPKITATHVKGTKIFRNQINTLKYTVENFSSAQVKNVRLKIKIHECEFMSDSFTLEPKATRTVDIIVPGHAFFNDYELVNTSVVISPDQSETVTITRQSELSVRSGMMIVDILNEEFVCGTEGQVRFTLENPGDGTVEFITARRNGSDPSDEITFTITDFEGNVHSTKSFKQVFGSRLITLSNGTTVARIPAKSTFMSDPIGIEIPYTAPEYIQIGLGIKNFYSNSGNENQIKMNGISTKRDVLLTETSYYGEIVSISPAKSSGKEDIVITGKGVLRASGDPVPDMPLKLYVSLKGFDRSYDILTDKNGDFTYTFKPAENEAGIYYVRVLHPKRIDKPIHGQFEINKLFAPSVLTYSYPKNYKQTIAIPVELSEGFSATNLRLVRFAPDSGSMEIPDGIHMDEAAPVTLASGEKGTLNLKVWADNTAPDTLTLNYHLISDESAGASLKDIKITITFSEAKPYLTLSNTFIETGVVLNDQVSETLTLKNNGLMDMAGVRVSLTDLNGNKTPNWAALNVSGDIGAIAIGETASVGIQCAPDTTVAEGQYSFILKISGDNIPSAYVPVYVSVVENGTGSISLKLNDIYTGTLDANNQVIQGVSNAKVVLVKENLPSDRHEATSDAGGNVDITDLSPGYYHCRITVSKHTEYTDRLKVVPDVTTTKNIYLENQLVTVDWSVNEVTIQDSYNLELNTTYETDVPAAVVVPTSSSLKLPSMEPGQSYTTELEYKNHGLVAAENVRIIVPESDFYRYEILSVVPSTIEPTETVKVPVRVTCLKSLDGEGAGATGARASCFTMIYTYTCRKGTEYEWTYSAKSQICPTYIPDQSWPTENGGTMRVRTSTDRVYVSVTGSGNVVNIGSINASYRSQESELENKAEPILKQIINGIPFARDRFLTFDYFWAYRDNRTFNYRVGLVLKCGAIPSEPQWGTTLGTIKSRFENNAEIKKLKSKLTIFAVYPCYTEIQKYVDYNRDILMNIIKAKPDIQKIFNNIEVKPCERKIDQFGKVSFSLYLVLNYVPWTECDVASDAIDYILNEFEKAKPSNLYPPLSVKVLRSDKCKESSGDNSGNNSSGNDQGSNSASLPDYEADDYLPIIGDPTLKIWPEDKEPYSWDLNITWSSSQFNLKNYCRMTKQCKSSDLCCLEESCYPKGKEYGDYPGGSYIHPIKGFYTESVTDLTVKIPGGAVSVTRRYMDGEWLFSALHSDITINATFIRRNGAVYTHATSANSEYTYKFGPNRKITDIVPGGFKWENTSGDWVDYDSNGKILSAGNQNGLLVSYVRDGTGRIYQEKDRNGRTVLTYHYYANGKIEYVIDYSGRKVSYVYQNNNTGKLQKVTDVLNNDTVYGYSAYDIAGTPGTLLTGVTSLGKTRSISYKKSKLPAKPTIPANLKIGATGTGSQGLLYVESTTDITGCKTWYDFGFDYKDHPNANLLIGYSGLSPIYASYGDYIFAVKSPDGKIVETWYDGGFSKTKTRINGKTVELLQNEETTTTQTNVRGLTTTTSYDEWKNPIRIASQRGGASTVESFGYIIKNGIVLIDWYTNPKGIQTKFEYNDKGNLTFKHEANNTARKRTTSYSYYPDGSLKTESISSLDNPVASTVSYTYYDTGDWVGFLKSVKDPEGNEVTYSDYNAMGQARTIVDAAGKIWTRTFDSAGRETSAKDPIGYSGSVTYTDSLNKVESIDAEGKTSSSTYYPKSDATHEMLIETKDHDSNTVKKFIDIDGRQEDLFDQEQNHVYTRFLNNEGLVDKTIEGGTGNVTSYTYYSGTGLVKTVTYPTYETEYMYDDLGRLYRETDVFKDKDENGEEIIREYRTLYYYTKTGKIRKIVDPQDHVKTFQYDVFERLITENDNGEITKNTYDCRNNLLTLEDPKHNITRFEYYKNNLLKSKTMPGGQKEYYYYNANRQVKYLVDAKKQVVEKKYLDDGELEKERYFETIPTLTPSSLASVESLLAGRTPVKEVSYTYDKVGNPKTYTDGTTSGVYTYDNLYRVKDETVNYGAFSLANTYEYYKNGLPKSIKGPDNNAYTYFYNVSQLTDVTIPGQGTVTFSDYKWNSAQKMLLPGGTEFTYSYDDLMRLTGISSKAAGKAVMNYTYAYDSLSRITDKKTEHGNYAYGYDDHNRLTSATSPVFGNESFTYDDVGNRKTSGETAGTHQYSNNNELLRLDALSGAILPQQYHYNTSGSLLNTTSQSPTLTDKSFTYDVTDRLTKVENAAKTQTIADYSYDPFGRRLWKEVNGVKTYYFYSSQGLSGEYNASGQVIKTYGYLPGSAWTTDPLFMKVGATYYYYHNDHLGTPVKMTSSNGAVVWSANYKAFGEAVVDAASTVENNLRFPGQYYDKETGLHYNWNRYYDPKMGRYIGPDPLGFGGGDVNLYAYCGNNPVVGMDPMGLATGMDDAALIGQDIQNSVLLPIDLIPGFGTQWNVINDGNSAIFIGDSGNYYLRVLGNPEYFADNFPLENPSDIPYVIDGTEYCNLNLGGLIDPGSPQGTFNNYAFQVVQDTMNNRIVSSVGNVLSIAGGVGQIVTGIALMGAPTGVSQVMGTIMIAQGAAAAGAAILNLANKSNLNTSGVLGLAASKLCPNNKVANLGAVGIDLVSSFNVSKIGIRAAGNALDDAIFGTISVMDHIANTSRTSNFSSPILSLRTSPQLLDYIGKISDIFTATGAMTNYYSSY